MFNPFELMQAQSPAAIQAFGQQFGLSPDQTRRAMEALLPALTMGLQATPGNDPTGMARMFGLGGGAGSTGPRKAEFPFGAMFGPPQLVQAILQQAAASSGVGTQALRQMMPVMAGMLVATLVHLMLNSETGTRAAPPPEPTPLFPPGNPWAAWFGGLMDTPAPAPPPGRKPAPKPAAKAAQPGPRAPAGKGPGERGASEASLEVFQQMMQTGAEVQEQNVKAMREIFDAFWTRPPMDKAAPAPAPEEGTSDRRASPAAPRSDKPRASKPPRGEAPTED